MSEFVDGSAQLGLSDSEAEDEAAKVSLPDRFEGRGNAKAQQSAMVNDAYNVCDDGVAVDVIICVCVETDRAGPPRDPGAVQGREKRLRR